MMQSRQGLVNVQNSMAPHSMGTTLTGHHILEVQKHFNTRPRNINQCLTHSSICLVADSKECELNCLAKGHRFFLRLLPKVEDGTPCLSNLKKICIDGRCQVNPSTEPRDLVTWSARTGNPPLKRLLGDYAHPSSRMDVGPVPRE